MAGPRLYKSCLVILKTWTAVSNICRRSLKTSNKARNGRGMSSTEGEYNSVEDSECHLLEIDSYGELKDNLCQGEGTTTAVAATEGLGCGNGDGDGDPGWLTEEEHIGDGMKWEDIDDHLKYLPPREEEIMSDFTFYAEPAASEEETICGFSHSDFSENDDYLCFSMDDGLGDFDDSNRSIEIFFGNLTNFGTFYQSLEQEGFKTPKSITEFELEEAVEEADPKTTVNPVLVKKLCLVGHPLTSFKGLNRFKNLSEAWVTNCSIKELKWKDISGLEMLRRLYLFGGHIMSIEPLRFDRLKILWLSGNQLSSMSFLQYGLPTLTDLNVASNQITSLDKSDMFNCPSLQTLNLAGNPISKIQDIYCLTSLPSLRTLSLYDHVYGHCPVNLLCECRAMCIKTLRNITNLSGEEITDCKRRDIEAYISQRCLYYFANLAVDANRHCEARYAATKSLHDNITILGQRISTLYVLSMRCLQADHFIAPLPSFAQLRKRLLVEANVINSRIRSLRFWTRKAILRSSTMMTISLWEQKVEEWLKWLEFTTCGAFVGSVASSVTDPEGVLDKDNVRGAMHQIISSMSCAGPWPDAFSVKVESIVVLQDTTAERGMGKTHEDHFARLNEPKFIPPPPEDLPPGTPDGSFPFYGPPSTQQFRIVDTYIDPDYKHPPPWYPYPDSVPGLPERSQPLLLYLISKSRKIKHDPLAYFNKIVNGSSENYKDIRLTDCIWAAVDMKMLYYLNAPESSSSSDNDSDNDDERYPIEPCPENSSCVIFVMKVLKECLKVVDQPKKEYAKHADDCSIYELTRPYSYTPAYLVYLSFTKNEKGEMWFEGMKEDKTVSEKTEALLQEILMKVEDTEIDIKAHLESPYYLYQTHNGVKADLNSIASLISNATKPDPRRPHLLILPKIIDLCNVVSFLGVHTCHTITSLDVSNNHLNLCVVLTGMLNLKKLNLSHNNISTLSNLTKMPKLRELRIGWNNLRYFAASLVSLRWACRSLTALEILPNPFQDVRNLGHIPMLAKRYVPTLLYVDVWESPFSGPENISISKSDDLKAEALFTAEVMGDSWVRDRLIRWDLRGKCLISLDESFCIPPKLKHDISAADIDLSDNYLDSSGIRASTLIQSKSWRTLTVKLQLQNNCLSNLSFMGELGHCTFPNLKILNASNNHISCINSLRFSCPGLTHLNLSGNPLPCTLVTLNPLRVMKNLVSFDASRTPLSTHRNYAFWVQQNTPTVTILDGTPISEWKVDDALITLGGTLSMDWVERSLGSLSWKNLTSLSLPDCNLKRIELPHESLPFLMTLDVSGNQLSSLAGLGSLPKLRVLTVNHNSISSLGEPCPKCFGNFSNDSNKDNNKAIDKGKCATAGNSKTTRKSSSHTVTRCSSAPSTFSKNKVKLSEVKKSWKELGNVNAKDPWEDDHWLGVINDNPKFPNLEVLVLSHNGLTGLKDLHLHALPNLRSVILSCNRLSGLDGLQDMGNVKAIVLDNNKIHNVPYNSLLGCKSLKYLHLEHNRVAHLPRLPHLANLTSLFLAYNKIQSLTDINCLAALQTCELTLFGNPAAQRMDYIKTVKDTLPQLIRLDGTDLIQLQLVAPGTEGSVDYTKGDKTSAELARELDERMITASSSIKVFDVK